MAELGSGPFPMSPGTVPSPTPHPPPPLSLSRPQHWLVLISTHLNSFAFLQSSSGYTPSLLLLCYFCLPLLPGVGAILCPSCFLNLTIRLGSLKLACVCQCCTLCWIGSAGTSIRERMEQKKDLEERKPQERRKEEHVRGMDEPRRGTSHGCGGPEF